MLRFSPLVLLGCLLAGCQTSAQEKRLQFCSAEGVHLYRQGNFAGARECFQAALAIRPDDPGLLYNLAACYEQQGGLRQAERCYLACLDRDASHAECHHALSQLWMRTGRRDEAFQLVSAWQARNPDQPGPYAAEGILLHQAGDLPRAQAKLQLALEREPHYQPALVGLARIYEDLERPDRAVALYERVVADQPDRPEVADRIHFLLTSGAGRPRPD